MTTIDEIMVAAVALGDERLMLIHGRSDRDSVRKLEAELRTIITQAIAEARAEGAREMRDVAAAVGYASAPGGDAAHEVFDAIRALPLPAGREPVLLTPAEIAKAMLSEAPDEFRMHGDEEELAASAGYVAIGRAIETAVLAANGMTK